MRENHESFIHPNNVFRAVDVSPVEGGGGAVWEFSEEVMEADEVVVVYAEEEIEVVLLGEVLEHIQQPKSKVVASCVWK